MHYVTEADSAFFANDGVLVKTVHGIDLLIAGHEHALIEESYPDADGEQVPVMETGAHFENVGLVTIAYDASL